MHSTYLIKGENHPEGVCADEDDNDENEDHGNALVPLLAGGGTTQRLARP